tara:strand:+ start:275 stop:1471 length:1197 start_codon:yes stop_codon:yes gene_type:complete
MIGLLSINYKNAPIDIREKFDFSDKEKTLFYEILKIKKIVSGLMILSTCNRTEIYFENEVIRSEENKLIHNILRELVVFKSFHESLSPYVEIKNGHDATEHIFRLVCGLESMIIGEYQIVEQIKDSFSFSKTHNTLTPVLERMIQKSFEVNKFIRTNTDIDKGAVSISYAVVEKISRNLDFSSLKILIVGAGETSLLTIKYLIKKQPEQVCVVNRSIEKAKALANKYNIKFEKFEKLSDLMSSYDVVIFSTSSKKPLVSFEQTNAIIKERKQKNITLVDLSVPRNIPHEISHIQGVDLINIDNLKDQINANYKKRKSEIIKAEQLIDSFLGEFDQWTSSRELRPSILAIKEQFNSLLGSENDRAKFSNNLIRKIKDVSENGKNKNVISIINKIFSHNE